MSRAGGRRNDFSGEQSRAYPSSRKSWGSFGHADVGKEKSYAGCKESNRWQCETVRTEVVMVQAGDLSKVSSASGCVRGVPTDS